MIFLAALFAFQSAANAVMIGTQVTPSTLNSICFIEEGFPQSNDITSDYQCSGTLISRTEVLTAGHCVARLQRDPRQRMKVTCGSEIYFPTFITANPKFSMDLGTGDANASNDFAVVHLPRPTSSSIVPLPLRNPLERPVLDLSTWQCSGFGYGINSDGSIGHLMGGQMISRDLKVRPRPENPLSGVASVSEDIVLSAPQDIAVYLRLDDHRAALEARGLDAEADHVRLQEYLFLDMRGLIHAALYEGDSGGPLVCRANILAPWKVIGIASHGDLNRAFRDSNNRLHVRVSNTWVIPRPSEATARVN